ncbi:hypothetical protein [Pontivivens ytuae]|uniref:Uncharacterized protein n=1 Tax=Pontivivens ytuae TaxID=2789856 RepID=A0A7S9LQ85_9RHOB|nr:hypothetical protein [Pontivivens ytuae]QPH52975.1 hypothetical protein I0K15_14325 [Pontivivens ytuae]
MAERIEYWEDRVPEELRRAVAELGKKQKKLLGIGVLISFGAVIALMGLSADPDADQWLLANEVFELFAAGSLTFFGGLIWLFIVNRGIRKQIDEIERAAPAQGLKAVVERSNVISFQALDLR